MKIYNACLVALLLLFAACSKMDDTYKEFIKNGEIPYAGSVDSVKVFPGDKRIKLSWLVSDPRVTKTKIYWNNNSDSMDIVLKRQYDVDSVSVILAPMAEGAYSFDIFTFDEEGNKSIKVSTTGQVYGERYVSSLLPRPVKSALYSDGQVAISWGSADTHVTGTKIRYTDADGIIQQVTVPVDSNNTLLPNFNFSDNNDLAYTTVYLPDSSAIDLFETAYETIPVKGPPVEYAKTGWTATASDFDEPSGRGPANAIDNKSSTVWHMSKVAGLTYPHTITVDMGTVNPAYGFTFIQRTPLDGPLKLIEIEVSNDQATWEALGSFTLASTADKQYVELTDAVSFRYFRVIVRSDYKNGNFTALAEVGVYKR